MMFRFRKHRAIFLLAFAFTASLFSCVNDLESIKKVTFRPDDPDEKMNDLHVTYTDSGLAKIRVYAKLAESFALPEPVMKFRDGVRVEFYSEDGTLSSILTALYGEIDQKNGKMLVRDSVQLFNPIKNQRMETEVLYWNRKDSTIFSDKNVLVRTPKSVFFGTGIRTKQDFSTYTFLKPQGQMNMNEMNK